MKQAVTGLVLAGLLAGCGAVRESPANPFNWFGRGLTEPVSSETGAANPLIPKNRGNILFGDRDKSYRGSAVGEVTELVIERRPGGAILRATGVADGQGPYDVRLIKDDDVSDDTTLAYTLSAIQRSNRAGPVPPRTVTTALWLTDRDLNGVREIRVSGERNSRVSRR